MILLISAALACPEPVHPATVLKTADAARGAFTRMNEDMFTTLVAELEAGVDCLGWQLTPQQAAEIHTVRALASFLDSDEVNTGASFQAALAAEPTLSLDWLPPTHPIYFELRYAERTMIDAHRTLNPTAGVVVVDGRTVDEIALDRPAILQRQEGGVVVESVLVRLNEPLPEWAPLAPEPLTPEVKRRLWLGGATTASALASGALLARSAQHRDNYLNPNTPRADLAALEASTNLTSVGSIAMAGVAVGFGTSLVIVW